MGLEILCWASGECSSFSLCLEGIELEDVVYGVGLYIFHVMKIYMSEHKYTTHMRKSGKSLDDDDPVLIIFRSAVQKTVLQCAAQVFFGDTTVV